MKARRIYFVFETPEPHAGARERRARREGRWTMGPLHGAIVSSCGHRYGDFSFNDDDGSRDTLALDSVTLGELSQNDRHESSMSPSFAVRWFEVDPGYQNRPPGARARACRGGPQSSLAADAPEAQDREKPRIDRDRPLYHQLSWCRGAFSGT